MTLSKEQIKTLIDVIAATREQEVDCDGCLAALAEFAEADLAGKSLPEALGIIKAHLDICGECREEYAALRAGLEGLEEE